MTESEEELKNLLMKVKKESEKAGLKLSIQKNKIIASSSITSWQIDGENVETVTNFTFLGSKITVDGNGTHEIKKTLAPGKNIYDQPRQHITKQRHHLWSKVHIVKAMVFSVVMYGCQSWMECRTTDDSKLWRRLLRVPWTTRRSNQSILKEINPEYSLEGLMLKV